VSIRGHFSAPARIGLSSGLGVAPAPTAAGPAAREVGERVARELHATAVEAKLVETGAFLPRPQLRAATGPELEVFLRFTEDSLDNLRRQVLESHPDRIRA